MKSDLRLKVSKEVLEMQEKDSTAKKVEVGHLGGAAVFRRPPDRFLADSAVRRPVVLADSAGRRMGTWLIPPAADSDRWFGASLADSAGRRAGWLAG